VSAIEIWKGIYLICCSLNVVVALYDDQPMIVDISQPNTIKLPLTSAPKRRQIDEDDPPTEKQAAQDAKQTTTVACFTASGEHIIAGTNKGWLNIIEVSSRTVIYSNKLSAGVIVLLRLTSSGRDLVVNSSDRVIRVITLPNLSVANLDPDTIDIEVEHRIADVVNRLSWNHATFSSTGEYITATTYNNHDIYVWERGGGTLVKLLEGVREEHGVVEWHPQRPLIVACGLETGRIHVWSITPEQRWSALAPDFVEVEENVDYVEREDEFDIHPKEELQKRQLDLEDEDVDLWTITPIQGHIGNVHEEDDFIIPVDYNYIESESEEELIPVGRGEMRRKSPGDGRDYTLDGDADNEGEGTRKKKKGKRN
jgi:COMPASS component SWD1